MYRFRQGFYADVRTERRHTSTIVYKNGVLTENKERVTDGAFIRVFDGKMWYYASTENPENIQKELDGLYELAEANPEIDAHPIVRRFEVNREKKYLFKVCSTENIPRERKQKLLTDLFPLAAAYPEIKLSVMRYLDRHSDYSFYSSKGAALFYDYQTCGAAISCQAAADGKNFSFAYQKGKTRFEEVCGLENELKQSIEEGITFLKTAKDAETGDFPVILSPEAAGVFAHESFGHKSEADFMLGDETMKKEWSIGKKVGSDGLSIIESGTFEGCGYVPYDDEGTRATRTYLIKNGFLAGRLHSAETAAELGEAVTGNARAMGTEFEPIVRMTTTVIEGGDKTFDELVKNVKHGYFIKTIKHGSGMSTFTIAPNISYEIVDGKIAGPVKISVISGDVFRTLGLIDGLSKEAEILSFVTGGCGKMEQYPLPVGFGAPYVSVSKMKVQ